MALTGTFRADFSEFDDASRKSLAELQKWEQGADKVGTAVDRMVSRSAASLGGIRGAAEDFGTQLVSAADVAQQSFEKLPSMFSQVRAGLNEVAEGAGLTFAQLGLVSSAGLAIGVGYEAWQITRAVMEFLQLDTAVEKAWRSLLNFGDAGAEAAAAKADVLAKASKTAGRDITDMAEAMAINQRAFDEWNDTIQRGRALGDSVIQIEHWNQELDKVVKAGMLKSLQADIESHNFSQKDLAERYRISADAIGFFARELKDNAKVAADWAKEQVDAAKAAADAHKAAVAVELAELKIMDAFRQEAHKRQVEIIRIQTDQQTKAAADVNAAIKSEFDAQVTLNAAWGRDASGSLLMQHDALETLNRAMDALHAKKVEGISQAQQEQVLINAYTKQLYDEAVARDRVSGAAAAQAAAINGVTTAYWAQIDAAARAAGVTVIGNRPGEGPGINGRPPGFSLGGFTLGPTAFTPGVVSSHASGGPVSAGMAMLHDNEYVVPENGALVLRGGGTTFAPGAIVIQVNGTAEDVARQISDRIMKTIKQGTKLGLA